MSLKFENKEIYPYFIKMFNTDSDIVDELTNAYSIATSNESEFTKLAESPDTDWSQFIKDNFYLSIKLTNKQTEDACQRLKIKKITNKEHGKLINFALKNQLYKIEPLKMTAADYHFGVKLPIHFTTKQSNIIHRNANEARRFYNDLCAINDRKFKINRAFNGTYKTTRKHVEAQTVDELKAKIKCPKADTTRLITFGFNHRTQQWFADYDIRHDARVKYQHKVIKTYDKTYPKEHRTIQFVEYHKKGEYIREPIEGANLAYFDQALKRIDFIMDQPVTRVSSLDPHIQTDNRGTSGRHMSDSIAINSANQNYKAAWNMFRKINAGTPQFKRYNPYLETYSTACIDKHLHRSMVQGNVAFIDREHIKIPKLGVVKVARMPEWLWQRRYNTILGRTTISKLDYHHGYISIQLASNSPFEHSAQYHRTNRVGGIDLNVKNLLTDSDGMTVNNPKYYENTLNQLQKLSRKMSHRMQRAKNQDRCLYTATHYQHARRQVWRLHQHIMNQRHNYIYQQVKTLLNKYDVVVAEDLKIKNMIKNPIGARSIASASWRTLLTTLQYKAEIAHKQVVLIDYKNTTQTCNKCGYICGSDERSHKLTTNERKWTCPNCGTHHNRDMNAACNIRDRGIKQLQTETD